MAKLQFQYEILKLKDEPLKEGEINYARFIQDNFDQIERYLNKKVLGEEWTDWTPTYSAGGDMTYTSVTTEIAKYCVIDKFLFFQLFCDGTTGGTASTDLYFTLPKTTADSIGKIGGACRIYDSIPYSGTWRSVSTTQIGVNNYNRSNWLLGPGKSIYIQGFYRIK